MHLPTLTTDRLQLRQRRQSDLEACFAMDREPGTLDWIDWPEEAGSLDDEAAHRAFIHSRIAGPYPEGLGYWTIEPRDAPATFLGWILLLAIDADRSEVEIGWRIPTVYRGKGYATEAARAVLKHAFKTLGLTQIVADIYPQNVASRSVAEKLGMTEFGPIPRAEGLLRYTING